MKPTVSHFFNALSIVIRVQCDDAGKDYDNTTTPQMSAIPVRVSLDRVNVFPEDEPDRDPFPEEWNSVAYHAPQITFTSDKCPAKTFCAPNGRNFTVKELLACLLMWEQLDRQWVLWRRWSWVDCSHVYFEGIHEAGDGMWCVYWGS
jgi:hypothetical protein